MLTLRHKFFSIIFITFAFYYIQISRKERPLYVQAANCVEEKEWIDLLNKVRLLKVQLHSKVLIYNFNFFSALVDSK